MCDWFKSRKVRSLPCTGLVAQCVLLRQTWFCIYLHIQCLVFNVQNIVKCEFYIVVEYLDTVVSCKCAGPSIGGVSRLSGYLHRFFNCLPFFWTRPSLLCHPNFGQVTFYRKRRPLYPVSRIPTLKELVNTLSIVIYVHLPN